MLVGILPFSSVEGDEQAVINGVREMMKPQGADLGLRHDYSLQPGAYWLTIGANILTRADPAYCYYALSAACALAFALLVASLISSLARLGFLESLSLTLLFQEVSRAAFYANSSTLGGFFVLLGLWLTIALRSSRWTTVSIAGILFGIGGWCRLDALALTPCLFPILLREERSIRSGLLTLTAALLSIVTLIVLLRVSDVSLRDIFGTYSGRNSDFGYRNTVIGFYEIASLSLLFPVATGVFCCVSQRDHYPIALLAAVLVPTLFLYSHSVSTPKYLYYTVPFIALLAALGLRYIINFRGAWIGALLIGIVTVELITGIRTTRTETRRFTPEPTILALSNFRVGPKHLQWVVGPGEIISNADGLSIWTGLAYSGMVWHREKRTALEELGEMRGVITPHVGLALLTSTYASYQCAVGYLRQVGFNCESHGAYELDGSSHLDRWVNGDRLCWLAWINMGELAPRIFEKYRDSLKGVPTYFFNDLGTPYAKLLLKDCPNAKPLGSRTDGFFALYQL